MAGKPKKKPSIVARTEDGSPVVEVFAMTFDGGKLIMDCKALGSMRMDVVVGPEDIAAGWPVIKESKSAVMAFGKRVPKAIRKWKKEQKKAASSEG